VSDADKLVADTDINERRLDIFFRRGNSLAWSREFYGTLPGDFPEFPRGGNLIMANILVIEDDEGVRSLLKNILMRAGHAVSVAEDGCHGMDSYREQAFDLVFTDLIMPDKDGLEVIREIRQINREAKIIGMSGGSVKFADTYLKLAHGFGASRLLPKPFLITDVLAIVDELLPDGLSKAG
jgi:CheY-like chemotaxis protein